MMISQREFFDWLTNHRLQTIKDNKKIEYYNVPASFDIEVTSFYDGEKIPQNKRAIMYIWQFGICDQVTYGRTWEEFELFIELIQAALGLTEERRLLVFVHNLPYEWQFIRKRFKWDKVFLLEDRKPVSARYGGIEFRCSLKLSGGKSLANVGKDLVYHKIQKKTGDLDYNIIRTPNTPLTDLELGYCEYDIRVLNAYIDEKIQMDGNITRIPLTNTGYVRDYCRKACFRAAEEVSNAYGSFDS